MTIKFTVRRFNAFISVKNAQQHIKYIKHSNGKPILQTEHN